MSALNPWNLNPPGPLDRHTSYWYATLNRLSYAPAPHTAMLPVLALVEPATTVLYPAPPGRDAQAVVATFPNDKRIVIVRGTVTPPQWAGNLFGTTLGSTAAIPGWGFAGGGHVNLYFALQAADLWGRFGADLVDTHYTLTGHSLGGVTAAMMSTLALGLGGLDEAPMLVIDFASPRPGNGRHALFAQQVARLRFTNEGDPIPMCPPSTNTFLDNVAVPRFLPAPPLTYRHWGERVHLWHLDGSATRPPEGDTALETVQYLRDVIFGTSSWLASHDTSEYARRLRAGIPVPWPAVVNDPDFPGIHILDGIHAALNLAEGLNWPPVLGPDGEFHGDAGGGWEGNAQPAPPLPQVGQPLGPPVFRAFVCE